VLGIYLSNVPHTDYGAFTVWPDDRTAVKAYFEKLTGIPARKTKLPSPTTSSTVVSGPAGTAFLFHGAVLHCNAMRTVEKGTRDAVFFRLFRAIPDVRQLLLSGGADWNY
jgi:hypothetical protein